MNQLPTDALFVSFPRRGEGDLRIRANAIIGFDPIGKEADKCVVLTARPESFFLPGFEPGLRPPSWGKSYNPPNPFLIDMSAETAEAAVVAAYQAFQTPAVPASVWEEHPQPALETPEGESESEDEPPVFMVGLLRRMSSYCPYAASVFSRWEDDGYMMAPLATISREELQTLAFAVVEVATGPMATCAQINQKRKEILRCWYDSIPELQVFLGDPTTTDEVSITPQP